MQPDAVSQDTGVGARPLAAVAAQVDAIRRAPRHGAVIDLVPYAPEHHETIIALRNRDRATYFLHQPAPLTLDGQGRWFAGYLERHDDLQWVIARKDGRIIGATALYGIADDRSRGEKGRLVIDDAVAREAPYVLEAELMLLDIALSELQLARIDTCVRHDNGVMQSINARLGFVQSGAHDIRGVEYYDYALTPDRYHPDALAAIVAQWAHRLERQLVTTSS